MGAAAGTARRARSWHSATRLGVYRPRRPRASALYRLIEDHFEQFATVYDERTVHACRRFPSMGQHVLMCLCLTIAP